MKNARMGEQPRRRRPSTRSTSLKLIGASLAGAAVIGGGLSVQMAHGHDPALGSGSKTAQDRAPRGTQPSVGAQTPAAPPAADPAPPASVVTQAS